MIKSKCQICSTRKSKFITSKVQKGGSIDYIF